jgi:hypothetical protein
MHRLQTVLYWVAQISMVLAAAAAVAPKAVRWV